MSGKIETVVFDIGNVLIHWDPRHLYRSVFEDEAAMEAFLATVCTMEWHVEHDRGLSFGENGARLKAAHPAHVELIDLWGARYLDMTPDRVPGTAGLIEALKAARVPVHGLTNMPPLIFPALCERYPELLLLETTVVSGDEGVIKPDRRIYEILIDRTGLEPARTLFIDDSPRNVAVAAELGFEIHLFTGSASLAASLREHRLLSAP